MEQTTCIPMHFAITGSLNDAPSQQPAGARIYQPSDSGSGDVDASSRKRELQLAARWK